MKKINLFFMAIFLVLSIAGCGASQASTTAAKIDTAIETKAIEPAKEDTTARATPSNGVVSTTTVLAGKKLTVSYIDVGQADSILIQTLVARMSLLMLGIMAMLRRSLLTLKPKTLADWIM